MPPASSAAKSVRLPRLPSIAHLLTPPTDKAFSETPDWTPVGTGLSRAVSPLVKLDLSSEPDVLALLSNSNPAAIVHCAAERFPDKCAADPSGTLALNVAATSLLARECAARGIPLVYISTDYVFPGAPGEAPYTADAPTSPPNFYGETKLEGEKAVLGAGGKGVVLRVPVLYGETEWAGESAVGGLVDVVWNREGKKSVEMDDWSIRYPTNTGDVAGVVVELVRKVGAEEVGERRVFAFSAEERMTKYQICQLFGELLGLPVDHIVPNAENDPNAKGGVCSVSGGRDKG